MKKFHPGQQLPNLRANPEKKVSNAKRHNCTLCDKLKERGTVRIKRHLKEKHGLKGEELNDAAERAPLWTPVLLEETLLEQALEDYCGKMTDRSQGKKRSESTAKSHRTGIRFYLPAGLSKESILAIENYGTAGGFIDQKLAEEDP